MIAPTLINNTSVDLRTIGAEDVVIAAIKNDQPLPEEIADLFNLTISHREDGSVFGLLNFA